MLLWTIVPVYVLKPDGEDRLAGAEGVISQAGKTTHGWGRFYSSLAQRPIPSGSFLAGSLVAVQARRAYPLQMEPGEPPVPEEKWVEAPPKRQPGRPKGSQNPVKPVPRLTSDWTWLQRRVKAITTGITPVTVQPIVLDGHVGTDPAPSAVPAWGLPSSCKRRQDAALSWP
jgi:putative transposase